MAPFNSRRLFPILAVVMLATHGTLHAALPMPLDALPKANPNEALRGVWARSDPDGNGLLAVVMPFDDHTFVVETLRYSRRPVGQDGDRERHPPPGREAVADAITPRALIG